ncbi:hypothetical protein Tco_0763795 [Tanacetum coccineum]
MPLNGLPSTYYLKPDIRIMKWLYSEVVDTSDPTPYCLQVRYGATRIVVAMIVPMVWQKYDYKIREHGKRLQKQSNGFYTIIDARVVQKIKSKFNVILV